MNKYFCVFSLMIMLTGCFERRAVFINDNTYKELETNRLFSRITTVRYFKYDDGCIIEKGVKKIDKNGTWPETVKYKYTTYDSLGNKVTFVNQKKNGKLISIEWNDKKSNYWK